MGMRMARAVNVVDLLLALCSGIFLMAWIMVGVVEEWQSLILVAWTVVFAFGAFLAVRLGAGVAYFYSYAGVGVVLLGVATAIELDGPSLTIAATIETALVLWLGYRITGNVRAVPILALPSIIPILMSFESMGSYAWGSSYGCSEFMAKSSAPCTTSLYWYERLFHADAFVLFFITIVMTLLGCFFYVERVRLAEEARARVKTITTVLWSIAGVYTAILVWLVAHAIFVGDEGTTTALVVYAVAGSLFYMVGRANGKRWQRVIAGLLLGFVVLHLVFVEMVDMPVELKWITFFGIGALFMLVAWLARNRMHGAQKTSG